MSAHSLSYYKQVIQ